LRDLLSLKNQKFPGLSQLLIERHDVGYLLVVADHNEVETVLFVPPRYIRRRCVSVRV
jgi:hypothetical protein